MIHVLKELSKQDRCKKGVEDVVIENHVHARIEAVLTFKAL